jgi:hypothetical protein
MKKYLFLYLALFGSLLALGQVRTLVNPVHLPALNLQVTNNFNPGSNQPNVSIYRTTNASGSLSYVVVPNSAFQSGGSNQPTITFATNYNPTNNVPILTVYPIDVSNIFVSSVYIPGTNQPSNGPPTNCNQLPFASDPGYVLPGFASNVLFGSADDISTNVTLPFTVNFCGVTYTNVWINEDGNVTLDRPFGGHPSPAPGLVLPYQPAPLTNANRIIFAPFWADLDTTANGASVSWGSNCACELGMTNQTPAFGVTWSNVDYYHSSPGHIPSTNTFQLLLISRPDLLSTNSFDLQFRYSTIQWDTSDSDGGAGNGLCGPAAFFPACVGFAGSSGSSCVMEMPGSRTCNALLDNAGTNALATSTNGPNWTTNGVYTWHFANGSFQ